MKRVGFALMLAVAGAVVLAACLKELSDPTASLPSGTYGAAINPTITATKPDDCGSLTVEVRRDGELVSRRVLVSDGSNTTAAIAITRPATLEVKLLPGPDCWVYFDRTATFEYMVPAPSPPDMTMPPPPDMTLLPDLKPPPDMIDPCANGVQDGVETDIDCGGSECTMRCIQGQKCIMTSDCVSGAGLVCFNGRCIAS